MHLPLGLFGIAVGTVALPTISKYVAEKKYGEVRSTLFDSLKLVFFLTVSSAVIIAFLSYPITRIIYERGMFTPFDTYATTQALILYIIGIPFVAGIRNVAAVFYAYRDAKTPMYASFVAVAVNIVLNLLLMRIIGFRAFPLSTTISSFVNLAILFHYLPRKVGRFKFLPLVKYFVLLAIAACAAGLTAMVINDFLVSAIGLTFFKQILNLLISGSIGLAIFYSLCLILGLDEAKDFLKRLVKR